MPDLAVGDVDDVDLGDVEPLDVGARHVGQTDRAAQKGLQALRCDAVTGDVGVAQRDSAVFLRQLRDDRLEDGNPRLAVPGVGQKDVDAQSPVVIAGQFVVEEQRFGAQPEEAAGHVRRHVREGTLDQRVDDLFKETATGVDDAAGQGFRPPGRETVR